MVAKKIPGATTHPNEWGIWRGMRSRCNRSLRAQKSWKKYWEKNIRVCSEWDDPDTGFKQFLQDMGPRPTKDHSIDRIDNNGNYEPSNCRWATPQEQATNRDSNRTITYRGETLTCSEWARRLGISRSLIEHRLNIQGWSEEKALSQKVRSRRRITFQGRDQTVAEWAKELDIPLTTICGRLSRGLPVEEVLSCESKSGKYERVRGKFYGRGVKK